MAKSKFKITGLSKKAEKRLSKSIKLSKKLHKKVGYDDSEMIWSQGIGKDSSEYINYTGIDKLTGMGVSGNLFYNEKGSVYNVEVLEIAPKESLHEDVFIKISLQGSRGYDKLLKFSQKYNLSSKHLRGVAKAIGENGIIDSSDVNRLATYYDSTFPGIVPNDPLSTYIAIGDSYAFA